MTDYEKHMYDTVQLFSATDPLHLPNRCVRYWIQFRDMETERFCEGATDWTSVNNYAQALCAEHDVCIVDRSDKGTYLHLTL